MKIGSYLTYFLGGDELTRVQKKVIKELRQFGVKKFDAIAFRGMSGALIAPAVAAKLKKELVMIRKSGQSHSKYIVEGELDIKNYVIIDDTIATGKTIDVIQKRVRTKLNKNAKCVAICLYNYYGSSYGDSYKDIPVLR